MADRTPDFRAIDPNNGAPCACGLRRLSKATYGVTWLPDPEQIEHTRSGCAPRADRDPRCDASRTDRQPPNTSTQAKGGESAVAPETTNRPDLVTHNEETT